MLPISFGEQSITIGPRAGIIKMSFCRDWSIFMCGALCMVGAYLAEEKSMWFLLVSALSAVAFCVMHKTKW